MKTYQSGTQVPYGLYASKSLDICFVNGTGEVLEGQDGANYIHIPGLVTLALLTIIGASFYFAFPVMVIGFVMFAVLKFALGSIRMASSRKAHLATMRWDPMMAYMKNPEDKPADKKDKKKNKTDDNKDQNK